MEFVLKCLTGTPFIPPVSFKLNLSPIDHPLGGSCAPDVEPGHLGDVIEGVEISDPLVDPVNLCQPVDILRRGWTIPLSGNQTSLGAGRRGATAKELGFPRW